MDEGAKVLVFVDANMGCILNLDGSVRSQTEDYEKPFHKVFDSRTAAIDWAKMNAPKSMQAICLLYDKNRKEEYIPLSKQPDEILKKGSSRRWISNIRKLFFPDKK
jgi:hypothetical protein